MKHTRTDFKVQVWKAFKVRAWKAGIKQPTKIQQWDFLRQHEKVAQKQNNLHSQGRQEKGDVKNARDKAPCSPSTYDPGQEKKNLTLENVTKKYQKMLEWMKN